MPKNPDINSVLVIGSGPIVIGQAAEFDYSGTQACHVLREEGVRVILVNSNPATIMTDPGVADATYVEPITPEVVEAIIAKERPDAVRVLTRDRRSIKVDGPEARVAVLRAGEVEVRAAHVHTDREHRQSRAVSREVRQTSHRRPVWRAPLVWRAAGQLQALHAGPGCG